MSAIKVKLVKGMSGHPEDQRETLRSLGLTRVGRERILPDNPSTLGSVKKVEFLIEWSRVEQEFKPFGRRSKALERRAKATKAAKA